MSNDTLELYEHHWTVCISLSVCVRVRARGGSGQRKKKGRAANDNIKMCVCVSDRICHHMNSAQSACELNHSKSFHIKQFNGTIPASEVFIPNPVHNLMAFESLPLPPG